MFKSFDDLKEVSQDVYVIVYIGDIQGVTRLCYLQLSSRPLVFYNYTQAKEYFYVNNIDTCSKSLWFIPRKKLLYPEAKIVKMTLSNFVVVEEEA